MVVRLRQGKSIRGALSYNEQKVAHGKAELLLASGFSCDIDQLGFSAKLKRFTVLNERRRKVGTNTLHLSLNFPPNEIISAEKMQKIALDYMDRIGFAGQPFLVYRHMDANHPHVHIVTNTIRDDGSAIDLNNIGIRLSEPARKALEQEYGLIPAESKKPTQLNLPNAVDLLPAEYGKAETKHTITNILGEVIRSYTFCNLDELNTILRKFSLVADRGDKNSLRYQKGGLVYSILDKEGFKTGNPIKASSIYGSPTLKELEKKFTANAVKKVAKIEKVRKSVDWVLLQGATSQRLINLLLKRKIQLDIRTDAIGQPTGVYFIDHFNRAAFSNEDLGITLPELIKRLQPSPATSKQSTRQNSESSKGPTNNQAGSAGSLDAGVPLSLLYNLLRPVHGSPGPAGDFTPKKKKKKRKGPSQ